MPNTLDKMTVKLAIEITGGFSNTSKMPEKSTGTPAIDCKTGAKLVKIKGSVCEGCYALKGAYIWPKVKNAYDRRLKAIDNPQWIEAYSFLINKQIKAYFRWHDSGDVQSVKHLRDIAQICRNTPNIKHWLPTRELEYVKEYLTTDSFPVNLIVRISSFMIDQKPFHFEHTSTVHKEEAPHGIECMAYTRKNDCGDCRLCWDKSVPNISYKKH